MSIKNIPEISRIGYFEYGEIIQIFGENFTENTKLYLWQAKNDGSDVNFVLDDLGGVDGRNAYKAKFAASRTVNFEELDTVEESLPELPPENAKVFTPDAVYDHCIYFGDKPQPKPDGEGFWLAGDGTHIVWLENENGMSKPAIANRPEIWNTSFKKINAGERIMIFGDAFGKPVTFNDGSVFPRRAAIKNLETGECYVLEQASTTGYYFDVQKYQSEYSIPKDVKTGKYNLYLHSSTCGRFGWSKPVEIEIVEDNSLNYYFRTKWNRSADVSVVMPECKIITISADDTSPLADYAEKIQSAIDTLEETGGLVVLSSGTFPVSKTIDIKPDVVLLGAGKTTILKTAEGKKFEGDILKDCIFAKQPGGLRGWANDWLEHWVKIETGTVVRLRTKAGIEGVRIELGGGANIGITVADNKSDTVEDAFMNKVEVDVGGLSQFSRPNMGVMISAGILTGAQTNGLVIFDCKCWALQPIYILPTKNLYAKIINNEFHCRPRQVNESVISGIRHSIVSNNVFADGRRSFAAQQGMSYNWLFQNRSIGIDRADCALESYMCEYGESEWSGHGTAFGENFVEINCEYDIMSSSKGIPYAQRFNISGRYLFIINGRGFAQYRTIVDVVENGASKKLILNKPFDVQPDETSAFSIVTCPHHNLWVDNNVALSNGHSQFLWGGGFDNVFAGHVMEMAAGIVLYAWPFYFNYEKTGILPAPVIAFNKIIRCQTKSSGRGVHIGIRIPRDIDCEMAKDFNYSRGIFGNLVTQCHFDGGDDNLNFHKNNHFPTRRFPDGKRPNIPSRAGITVGGGFNRVTDNYIYGHKKAIEFDNDCPGNFASRNDFRNEEVKVVSKAKAHGNDVE